MTSGVPLLGGLFPVPRRLVNLRPLFALDFPEAFPKKSYPSRYALRFNTYFTNN